MQQTQREKEYCQLVEQAGSIIFRMNSEGDITFINEYGCHFFGFTEKELLGSNALDTIVPEYQNSGRDLKKMITSLCNNPEKFELNENENIRKNGDRVWVRWSNRAISLDDSKEILCIGTDCTKEHQVVEALRESELRLRTLIETLPGGVFFKDGNGCFEIINESGINLFSLQDIAWHGKNETELGLIKPELAEVFQECKRTDELAWTEAEGYHGEESFIDNMGNRCIIDVTKIPLFNKNNERDALVILTRDATESKKIQTELIKSNNHLQFALQAAKAGAFFYNLECDSLEWDLRSMEIFGVTPGTFNETYNDWKNCLLKEDYQKVYPTIRDAIINGNGFDIEFRILRSDGKIRHIHAQSYAILDETGRTAFLAGLHFDITLQKEEEALHRATQQQSEALLDNTMVGIAFVDKNRNIIQTNQYLGKLFGFKENDTVIGQNTEQFYESEQAYLDLMKKAGPILTAGTTFEGEQRMRKNDGTLFNASIRGKCLDATDPSQGIIWNIEDISKRKEIEKQILDAQQKAEAANQAKSLFLANMSHELRTPLNAILGFSQLLSSDASLNDKQQQQLRTINRSGNYLLELINDVLDLSTIEAGKQVIQSEDFDLHILLQNLAELFQLRTAKKGLHFTMELSDQLPRYIKSDQKKMRQILINLLSNALKFTEKGSVILLASLKEQGRSDDTQHLCFEIKDTGSGISNTDQKKLFQPFVQTESGLNQSQGTGLGLSISRDFARLLGGDIHVVSTLGNGSTFHFNCPILTAGKNRQSTEQDYREVLRLVPGQKQYRILVCDDKEETLELMSSWLSPAGFRIETARNGLEAIEVWKQWCPHLIWMDMRMPTMNGYDATKRIKALPGGKETIIVAFSASAFIHDSKRMLEVGCDDFVPKPSYAEYIFDIMKRHLGLHYIYKDQKDKEHTIHSDDTSNDASLGGSAKSTDIMALPQEVRDQLQKAVILGDSQLLEEALAEITVHNSSLAPILQQMIDAYQYEHILQLLRKTDA